MKRLILFRHGKTERHAPSGEDFDRRLTVRGCEDAYRMGKVLAEAGLTPDIALVSSAERARQTWDAAKAAFPDVPFEVRPELYHADQRDLMRIARKVDVETVMIVAHNPGLHMLTIALIDEAKHGGPMLEVTEDFPTAAICAFQFDEAGVTALGLYVPRDHGGGSDHD